MVKKYHDSYIVLQANHIDPATYNFREHRADINGGLNESAQVITGLGLRTGLDKQTNKAVERQDHVYAVMEAVNSRYVTFARIGQFLTNGADSVTLVRDYLPIVTHTHFKELQWAAILCRLSPTWHGNGRCSRPADGFYHIPPVRPYARQKLRVLIRIDDCQHGSVQVACSS